MLKISLVLYLWLPFPFQKPTTKGLMIHAKIFLSGGGWRLEPEVSVKMDRLIKLTQYLKPRHFMKNKLHGVVDIDTL